MSKSATAMGDSAKSQISEKVMVGVISAVILAALAYLGRSFLLPLLDRSCIFAWAVIKQSSAWFFGGTVSSPAWLFCILASASLILFIIAAKAVRRDVAIDEPSWFKNYLADDFFGIKWRWRYTPSRGLDDPCAYCPTDDTILVYRKEYLDRITMMTHQSHAITLHCDTCGRQFGPFDGNDTHLVEKVMRQIDRKIRSGEWKQVVSIANKTT